MNLPKIFFLELSVGLQGRGAVLVTELVSLKARHSGLRAWCRHRRRGGSGRLLSSFETQRCGSLFNFVEFIWQVAQDYLP